jgi:hypothetical protein
MYIDSKRRSKEGWQKRKFRMHKESAARRGIPFQFDYEEWVAWWERHLGPEWGQLRGNKLGQFAMCRKGDSGPYHPDNVMCLTVSENTRMAHVGRIQTTGHKLKNSLANRGSNNARAKLSNKDAYEIYNTPGTISSLARKYKVSRPVIKGIKTGKNWSHVTGAK